MAALKGATTEWSKMEGLTFDYKRSRLYVAMSEVREGMEDNAGKGEATTEHDIGGPNHIRVPWNECGCGARSVLQRECCACGCPTTRLEPHACRAVYALDVGEDFKATSMYGLICGDKDANTDEFNLCNKEAISQPDNLAYVAGHDGLIIGEDTDTHQNDAMWYHDFESGATVRMLTTPYGSETTSPYWYPNINGWSYIMAVVQHPYGETDEDKVYASNPGSASMYNNEWPAAG